jgi:hypothetical protein
MPVPVPGGRPPGDAASVSILTHLVPRDVHGLVFLDQFEELRLHFEVEVSVNTGGASEVGMQAFYGDPLNVSAPGGALSVSLLSDGTPGPGPGPAPGSPVPQPGSLLLVALGLVGLGRHRLAVLLRCARAS